MAPSPRIKHYRSSGEYILDPNDPAFDMSLPPTPPYAGCDF